MGEAYVGNAAQIGDLIITAAQIANLTITAAQIANLTITAAEIANSTITTGKVADDQITTPKRQVVNSASWTTGILATSDTFNAFAWSGTTITHNLGRVPTVLQEDTTTAVAGVAAIMFKNGKTTSAEFRVYAVNLGATAQAGTATIYYW